MSADTRDRNRRKRKRVQTKKDTRKRRQTEAKEMLQIRVRSEAVVREVTERLFNSLLAMGGPSAIMQHREVPETTMAMIHPRLRDYANTHWATLIRDMARKEINRQLSAPSIVKDQG